MDRPRDHARQRHARRRSQRREYRLEQVKVWSDAVNKTVEDIVHGVPPFPLVRESLEKLNQFADACASARRLPTRSSAKVRAWHRWFCEDDRRSGNGDEDRAHQVRREGQIRAHEILMIGDAPGDFNAAKKNGALFFPITPGSERNVGNVSW